MSQLFWTPQKPKPNTEQLFSFIKNKWVCVT